MDIFESLENLNVSEECFDEIMGLVEELLSEGGNLYQTVEKQARKKYPVMITGRQYREDPSSVTEHPNYKKREELKRRAWEAPGGGSNDAENFWELSKGERGETLNKFKQQVKNMEKGRLGRYIEDPKVKAMNKREAKEQKRIKAIKKHNINKYKNMQNSKKAIEKRERKLNDPKYIEKRDLYDSSKGEIEGVRQLEPKKGSVTEEYLQLSCEN